MPRYYDTSPHRAVKHLPKRLQSIGSFNGLAMALLFGRYFFMEHSAYNMEVGKYRRGTHNNQYTLYTTSLWFI